MNSLLDRIALLVTALALLLASWAVFRIGAEWAFPVLTLIALVALFAENARLRKSCVSPVPNHGRATRTPKPESSKIRRYSPSRRLHFRHIRFRTAKSPGFLEKSEKTDPASTMIDS
ncbi:hypothetical protein [Burkholderia gladioli]|uniref:hypothetical protein n=1 Tax=Burkholderia gladioli TaxID=28095 RepID=UPI0026505084|nr:hypothetical protein [Burkholderia gladioli]MDN7811039.1 hypothetical protein [Burkholderia gladioli]